MATMEGMDAGAWCAGLPMARWSKCYYPRGVMQLFGEGPHDVNDKIDSPIISKKKRTLKVLCSSLIFVLLVVVITLMVFFIIRYKDNSTNLSKNTAITKNVNVLNSITIVTTGNGTSSSDTSIEVAKNKVDVATAVQSLERKRWLAQTGNNVLLGPSVTKETSEAGGNSTGGVPDETKEDHNDISVEFLGTNNETKVAVSTIISEGDGGMIVEKTNITAPLPGPSNVVEAAEYYSSITILSTPEKYDATTISSTLEQDHASTIPSTPEQHKTTTIPSTTERYNTTTISSTNVHYNITTTSSTSGQYNNTTNTLTAKQYKNTTTSSIHDYYNETTASLSPSHTDYPSISSTSGLYKNTSNSSTSQQYNTDTVSTLGDYNSTTSSGRYNNTHM